MSVSEDVFLKADNLVKVYNMGSAVVEVLRGLDLAVLRGETLAVVGASGVGKSTLLNILGALEKPTSGRVTIGGLDLNGQDDAALAALRNRRIGFVFQFHHLLAEFNALENAAMPALLGREPRREAYHKAEVLLKRVGLADRMHHRTGELSGGEQQRVAVARALVMEPELLLADEPTGNLDSRTGRQIHELIAELKEEKGLTSVVVTHNLELAGMMSRRIRLVEGRAIEE